MIRLELVHPLELTDEDIKWLTLGCVACNWKKFVAVSLVRQAIDGRGGLYRFTGDGQGMIAVTQSEDEMLIEAVAGRGLLKTFSEVHEQLAILARSLGLKRLSGMAARKGLQHIYRTRTKAQEKAVLFVENLDDE
jgi:hypothetical protein